ncbi:MAG: iron ABC transporter permease, partial [Bacillota bacterium]|nr:iron ABC transporter permease [Bacillota bacterium]
MILFTEMCSKKLVNSLLFQCVTAGIFLLAVFFLCVSVGSVPIQALDTLRILGHATLGSTVLPADENLETILLTVRLPRVLLTALVGAALAISGTAMQGLLKNPLADGSTLGVSSGASVGAVTAIALSAFLPFMNGAGRIIMSVGFAFLSMLLILGVAYKIDRSLSTNTIILTGVIFSMFASSMTSLIIAFSQQYLKNIVFWTMGSFASSGYSDVLLMLMVLLVGGSVLVSCTNELNAFSLGEERALYIGVNVKAKKLIIMGAVSLLVGVSVAVSGTIAFVGLVIPHMTRML